jgi:hypothetical protein
MFAHWLARFCASFFLAATALVAGMVGAVAQTTQTTELAPPGESFSVQFPPNPTFHPDVPSKDIIAHYWTATQGGYGFFVASAVTKNNEPVGAFDATLKGDQDDVVSSMKASLVRSERIEWPGPNGPLPAILFAIRIGDQYGEYLEAISGKHVYAVFVRAETDSTTTRDQVDHLVRTLRITQ